MADNKQLVAQFNRQDFANVLAGGQAVVKFTGFLRSGTAINGKASRIPFSMSFDQSVVI